MKSWNWKQRRRRNRLISAAMLSPLFTASYALAHNLIVGYVNPIDWVFCAVAGTAAAYLFACVFDY